MPESLLEQHHTIRTLKCQGQWMSQSPSKPRPSADLEFHINQLIFHDCGGKRQFITIGQLLLPYLDPTAVVTWKSRLLSSVSRIDALAEVAQVTRSSLSLRPQLLHRHHRRHRYQTQRHTQNAHIAVITLPRTVLAPFLLLSI